MKLTASGLTLTDERVRLIDPPDDSCHLARKGSAIGYTGCLYRYPLRLGSDVLGRLHVRLQNEEGHREEQDDDRGVAITLERG